MVDGTAPVQQRASTVRDAYVFLLLLSITSFFNYLDRSIFSVLAVSIKADLGLSDSQIGLLGGLSFALFYAAMGLPIASLADRKNRVSILSVCLAVWSASTAACGVAYSFWQMLLARIGVGAGEAGCVPTSYSLIGDKFDQTKRAFAVGIFQFGGNLGFLCGLMLSGILAELVGWRMAFILIGLPGIAFAIVLRISLREPRRGQLDKGAVNGASDSRTKLKTVLARSTFRHLVIGYTLGVFAFYAALQWMPHVFARTHGMTSSEIGLWYGAAFGGGLVIGALLGAFLAPLLIMRDRRWEMWFPGLFFAASFPLFAFAILAGDRTSALLGVFAACSVFTMGMGPGLATIQSLSEASVRATASAFLLLVSAVIGQGAAPFLVGIGSDYFYEQLGPFSLQASLLAAQVPLIWSGIHFYIGGKRLKLDAVN